MEKVLYASAPRTATPTAVNVNTSRVKGLRLVIDVTAIVTTPSITVTVDAVDNTSGKFVNLLTSAAITTVSTTTLHIALGNTVTANVSASTFLPDTVRVTVTHANGNSITYTVSAHLMR